MAEKVLKCHEKFCVEKIRLENGAFVRPEREISQGKFGAGGARSKDDSGKYKSYQESKRIGYAPSVSTARGAGDVFLARERGGVEILQVFKKNRVLKTGRKF